VRRDADRQELVVERDQEIDLGYDTPLTQEIFSDRSSADSSDELAPVTRSDNQVMISAEDQLSLLSAPDPESFGTKIIHTTFQKIKQSAPADPSDARVFGGSIFAACFKDISTAEVTYQRMKRIDDTQAPCFGPDSRMAQVILPPLLLRCAFEGAVTGNEPMTLLKVDDLVWVAMLDYAAIPFIGIDASKTVLDNTTVSHALLQLYRCGTHEQLRNLIK